MSSVLALITRVTLWALLAWLSAPPLAVLYLSGLVLATGSGSSTRGGVLAYNLFAATYVGVVAGVVCVALFPLLLGLAAASRHARPLETTRAGVLATTLGLAVLSVVSAARVTAPAASLVADVGPWIGLAWVCLAWPRLAIPALRPGTFAAG